MTTEAGPNALLDAVAVGIDYPDADAAHAAVLRRAGRGNAAGTFGVLEELSAWAAGVQGSDPPRPFHRSRLVCFGGVPDPMLRTLAQAAGVSPVVVDLPAGTEPVVEPAEPAGLSEPTEHAELTEPTELAEPAEPTELAGPAGPTELAELTAAVLAGMAAADREVDAGADLLIAVELSGASAVAAAMLISVLTDTEPVKVVGRPPGTDDADWIANCAAIRDSRRLAWPHRSEPLELLEVAANRELAALTGFVLQAANRRTPVLLDGVPAAAAAALAQLACPRVVRWLQAAQLSPDPAHDLALQRLGLTPILRLDIWHGAGVGALLALPVLRAAVLSLNTDTDPDTDTDTDTDTAGD
jgi:nicotinate-nucleotide--dimethylbenzimidazole phosphoribosyltransferase